MKRLTEAAQAAKLIRKELKEAYPSIKFSVTSENFAGGNAVDIRWTDGPTEYQVNELTEKYEMGKFNASEDMYEYKKINADNPTVKYVQTHREYSQETKDIALQLMKKHFRGAENIEKITFYHDDTFFKAHNQTPMHFFGMRIQKMDLTNGFDNAAFLDN